MYWFWVRTGQLELMPQTNPVAVYHRSFRTLAHGSEVISRQSIVEKRNTSGRIYVLYQDNPGDIEL